MIAPAQPLSFGRKLGFTLGDYACNLYWQSISIFLLFFYTDAVGLAARTAGLIYMIASIVDAVSDPVMGALADRTRTRWGRYRPYILFGGVPLALAFVLLYWRPPLAGVWLATWMLGSHIVFRLAYTALSIPYTSLNARLTTSSKERATLAGMRMMFAVVAALTVSLATYPLVRALGAGDASRGYMGTAAVFGLIATALFPLVFAVTREPAEPAMPEARLDLAGYWRALAPNRAFWVLMIATVAAFVCSVAIGKSVLYYFKYYIRDEAASRYALGAMSAIGLLAIPAWVWISGRIGKRNAWFAASAWGLIALGVFSLVDIRAAGPMIVWLVVTGAGTLGLSFTFWSMLPDTVEYGQWVSGARAESVIFGLGQFFLKVALGAGAGLFGWLLDKSGYVANVPQAAATLASLKAIMVGLPAAGLVLAALAMIFYPMGRNDHDAIVEALAARGKQPN